MREKDGFLKMFVESEVTAGVRRSGPCWKERLKAAVRIRLRLKLLAPSAYTLEHGVTG